MVSASKLPDRVDLCVQPLLPVGSSILVGFSGGLDSVVLLHLLWQLAERYSWQLSALHIHHGISPNANAWADFCTAVCNHYRIPFQVRNVEIAPLRQHGVEAAARALRYQEFAAHSSDFVALAHHADDQAETLMLQLLRGAGVRGAASMPELTRRGAGPAYVRPLLHQSRSEILSYAVEQGLEWINDESNDDDYFPRNYLRHRVLPVLEKKFPAYRETLTRGAQHFAEASQLLDELAQLDGEGAIERDSLRLASLRQLSHSRAKNLLRYFLHRQGVPMPQLNVLNEMLRQLCDARRDASVDVQAGEFHIRRYMDSVYAVPVAPEIDPGHERIWNGEDMVYWAPQHKQLHFSRVTGAGVSLGKLQGAKLTLRLRSGSETIRPHAAASRRTLKNLLQQQHIPPWLRERIPLLYCGDDLVAVVGFAIDAAYQAQINEAGLLVSGE